MQLTELDRQGLSQDEIDILTDGLDEDGLPLDDAKAQLDKEEDDDLTDAPEPKSEPEAKAAPKADAPADDQENAPAASIEAQQAAAFVPQYTSAQVPADAAQQIAALKEEERAAFKLLMDGNSEMDADAYSAIKDRTEGAIDELKTKALTASIFQQANEQAATQAATKEWISAQASCFAAFKADGIDYQDKSKPGLLAAFNHHLKAAGANPANEHRDAKWFLEEADRLTRSDLGIQSKPAAKTAAPARGVDKSTIPPTLSRVPPAADVNVAGDEFAHYANLDGAALEKAVAKMTPEQLERYLN